MADFPLEVNEAKNYFLENKLHPLFYVAEKLIISSNSQHKVEIAEMWHSYLNEPVEIDTTYSRKLEELRLKAERERPYEYINAPINKTVCSLLYWVNECRKQPKYTKLLKSEQKKLVDKINKLSDDLANLLEENELNVPIYSLKIGDEKIITSAFYIDGREGTDVDAFTLIREIAHRASLIISSDRVDAKKSENQEAVKFARRFAEHNKRIYGKSLYKRVAVVTNALYATNYNNVRVSQLLNS